MLIGLALLSIPIIRNRFYNFFYRLHIPLYIAFLGTMFWHTGQVKDSWAYLWATLALWLFSVLIRLFCKWQTFNVRRSWFSGMPATIQWLPGNMTRVTVSVPANLRWKPGQHCFLRIPHLSMFQNHPFTIANLPVTAETSKYLASHNMDFYIRACNGLTLDLTRFAMERKEKKQIKPLQVHIDGPYGGLVEDVPKLYHSFICVAGGSGISACLPHIQYAARRIQSGNAMVSHIRLLWIIKQLDHANWALEELRKLNSALGTETLRIDFYITCASTSQEENIGHFNESISESTAQDECRAENQETSINVANHMLALSNIGTVHSCRPYLPEVLPPLLSARRIMILGISFLFPLIRLGNYF
jgi:predicted ferric reductase